MAVVTYQLADANANATMALTAFYTRDYKTSGEIIGSLRVDDDMRRNWPWLIDATDLLMHPQGREPSRSCYPAMIKCP